MGSDDVAAILAGIRERYRKSFVTLPGGPPGSDAWTHVHSADDIPRLLAAVEAGLAAADMLPPQAPPSSALEEDRMWIRSECADMIREAITAALTGTQLGEDEEHGTAG